MAANTTKKEIDHADVITKCMSDLIDEIDFDNAKVWDGISGKGIFSRGDVKQMRGKKTTDREQARVLLHRICQCPKEDYDLFVEVLRETTQKNAVKILEKTWKDMKAPDLK